MSGFDIMLAVIILIAIGIEAFRGFGRAVFDGLGLYLALIIAHCTYLPLAGSVHFHNGAADNHAAAYAVIFVSSSIIMLCLSRFVYGTVLYNAGVFDQLFGVVAGIVIGVMVAHGITTSISLTDPNGNGRVASYTDTALSNEVLNFTAYHHFMESISSFGDNQRSDPTAG
ncbi:MAG TPA: CvpA family protein [Capsulimonadaceae bacterium]|nr:CvpA family protein [Capsulimonadaceae bacterium]